MKSHRPRVRAQSAKRLMRPRFAQIGNPALRNLYLGDTEPYVPPAEELEIPLNERKYIQTLTETCCRWPIGDPQQADFHFCGKSKVAGLPYCEFHARRAFQPPQPRRRDREVHEPLVIVAPEAATAPPASEPGAVTGEPIAAEPVAAAPVTEEAAV
jgi:GcrA cell cycle regulator